MNTKKATPRTVMVRYTTTDAQAAANEALVHAVFDELRAQTPGGLRYATFRVATGATFIHIATLESADENPLTKLAAFRAFQKDLTDRCVEPPVVTEVVPVDSYAFGG